MSGPDDLDAVEELLKIADVAFVPDPEAIEGEFAEGWRLLNAEIGYIASAWAQVEMQLAHLLAALLKSKTAYAQVMLGTLVANKVKRDLVLNVARLALAGDRDLHRVNALLRRMAKAAGKRNFLIHGIGTYHTKHPHLLTVMGVSADLDPALSHYQTWGLPDLRELRCTLNALSADLWKAAEELRSAKRRTMREKPLPGPRGGKIITNSRRPRSREMPEDQPPSSPEAV